MYQSPFEQPHKIIEIMMKAYIIKVNEALDGHVRPIEYEDCLDPRAGMVEGMKAALSSMENAFRHFQGPIGNYVDNDEWNKLLKIVLENI